VLCYHFMSKFYGWKMNNTQCNDIKSDHSINRHCHINLKLMSIYQDRRRHYDGQACRRSLTQDDCMITLLVTDEQSLEHHYQNLRRSWETLTFAVLQFVDFVHTARLAKNVQT